MDISSFLKRILTSIVKGYKKPIHQIKSFKIKDKKYSASIYQVLKKDVGKTFFDNFKEYEVKFGLGHLIKLEKDKGKVLIGIYYLIDKEKIE